MKSSLAPKHTLPSKGLVLRILLGWSFALSPTPLLAKGRYNQIVVNLPEKREFHYDYSPGENILTIEFNGTSQAELAAFDRYDESLVRKIIVKDLGGHGSSVRIFFRDRHVRATVLDFEDPYRISVELFDVETQKGQNGQTAANEELTPNLTAEQPASDDPEASATSASVSRTDNEAKPALINRIETSGSTAAANGQPRKLLQPAPEAFTSSEAMLKVLQETSDGIGAGWKSYPIYIYRIQTAIHDNPRKAEAPNLSNAMSSSEAMAEFAAHQFDFGHESKALIAYQQVLLKSPQIFQKAPLHLWRLAEIHLGQGNLTLADGYYEEFVSRFPGQSLQAFAQMRRLDIKAIQLNANASWSEFDRLVEQLGRSFGKASDEFIAQAALRTAWWGAKTPSAMAQLAGDRYAVPQVSTQVRMALTTALPKVESQKTAFLASSLILTDMTRPNSPWSDAAARFAVNYVEKYDNPSTGAMYTTTVERTKQFLASRIQQANAAGNWLEATSTYEQLSKLLAAIRSNPLTAWALAESYRNLGKFEKAVPMYAISAKGATTEADRCKSVYWLAATTAESITIGKRSKTSNTKLEALRKQFHTSDAALFPIWERLDANQKGALYTAIRPSLETSATTGLPFRSASRMVLEAWTKALTSPSASTDTAPPKENWQALSSPSAAAVPLLSRLSKRFSDLGLDKERHEALRLLRYIKPADLKDDPTSRKLWTDQIIGLADEYRKANENLEAGRLFALAGKESADWEGRAGALYRGGLLLLASGRKQEALDAFTLASEDSGNLYYSSLAKERLNSINANGGNR